MRTLKAFIWMALVLFSQNYIHAQIIEDFLYTSPRENAKCIKPEQDIILKTSTPIDPESLRPGLLSVSGEESGKHTGNWMLSEDGKTCIFRPEKNYTSGEKVFVSLNSPMFLLNGNQT